MSQYGDVQPPSSTGAIGARLSVMMFLQYAIWGAWLPLLWPFLSGYRGFKPEQIGTMFAVGAVGAVVGPFVAGQVADRHFSTERFLGVSHIVGAILVWQLAKVETYWTFLVFSLTYSLVYSPTLSLTNSICLHHLPDRDKDFSKVRVWGTVGWIAVGIGIGQWLLHVHTPSAGAGATSEQVQTAQFAGMADAFRLSAILGLVLGLYCFTLPRTPPTKGTSATFKAIGEARRQPLLTLFLLAVPISCIHQFYFVHTSGFVGGYQAQAERFVSTVNSVFGVGGGGLMTIGQMSELVVLALLPLLSRQLSRKTLLAVGIAAYAARMALFAYVEPISETTGLPPVAVLIAGIAMHGLCFGCFIFVSFLVIDENTSADVRASAQSLLGLVVFGVGIIVGSQVAGYIAEKATDPATKQMDYTTLFSYPMWGAIGCLVILLAAYPARKK